jgi:hypothetical protein
MNSFHKDNLEALQKFQQMLNAAPDKEGIEKTPDGKAVTLVVSHVETTLDEMFFGHWRTENFKWERMANEVVGSLDLVVIHPITGYELRRTGAASIVIMVDKVPSHIAADPIERNRWALNADNKKPNALDLAFPKLKTECLKNAAVSFGKLLGRDLNRKNVDVYKPFKLKGSLNPAKKDVQYIEELIGKSSSIEDLEILESAIPPELLQSMQELINVKKQQLSGLL